MRRWGRQRFAKVGDAFRSRDSACARRFVQRVGASAHADAGADERGSVLPLTIGYALLAGALILVCVCATDLQIAQKRLDAVADAAALAGSEGFTVLAETGEALLLLTDAGVSVQAEAVVAASGAATLDDAFTPDGTSARVIVSTVWHPPLVSAFVPDGVTLRSTATSRTGLR